MGFQKLTPDLNFTEAFEIWLKRRTIAEGPRPANVKCISKKTLNDYICNKRALEKYFGSMRLGDIDPGDLMVYQAARASCDRSVGAWARQAGANCIAKEISLLLRMLREAGVWGEEQDEVYVRVQREQLDVPRALSVEEQATFLAVAAGKEDFHFIYWYALLALDSTCSAGELRCLKLGDVAVDDGIITVRWASSKNKHRRRTIALLEEDAVWALRRLIERARDLGATAPHHYLFPICEEDRSYDPTRPMSESGLKKRFNSVKEAAKLHWFKPNGFRHSGLTRLAEGGTPIHVLMARAGHIEEQTQSYYVQISLAAQRRHSKKRVVERPVDEPTSRAPKKPPVRQSAPAQVKVASAHRFFLTSSTSGF